MHLKELKQILTDNRLFLSRARGQNFLIDDNIIRSLLNTADIQKEDEILEIGTGLGALTTHLINTRARIISYEIDKGVFSVCRNLLGSCSNLELIHGDFLVSDFLSKFRKKFRVIANVPYNISSQILIKLWLVKENIEDVFILLQKEVGLRLASSSPGKETGFLPVLLQLDFEIKIVKKVPKSAFYPVPQVDSVYIVLKPKQNHILKEQRADFFAFLKYSFGERRKKLLPRLKKIIKDADLIFKKLDIDENIRADMIENKKWTELFYYCQVPMSSLSAAPENVLSGPQE